MFFFNLISNKKLERRSQALWVEDSFVPRDDLGEKKEFLGCSVKPKNLLIALSLVFLLLFGLWSYAFYLQIISGGYYKSLAENNRLLIKPIKPKRGIIYDRAGRQLVLNVPTFSLELSVPFFRKNSLKKQKQAIDFIARVAGKTSFDIEAMIKSVSKNNFAAPVVVAENLSYDNAVLAEINNVYYDGISLITENRREYYNPLELRVTGESLGHVLGYTGRISETEYAIAKNQGYLYDDFIGKTGIELYYEKFLRGVVGQQKIEVNAFGQEKKSVAEVPAKNGSDIYLTIDLVVQNQLEKIMRDELTVAKKERAVAIVESAGSGEILAMVSLPAYDNNLFAGGISTEDYKKLANDPNKPLFNRSISGEYPSGSIFKPVMAAAALEEKIITEYTSFLSTGGIAVGEWFFPDWSAAGHGVTDVKKALAWSVNTFFYIIGGGYDQFAGLGVKRITDYARLFGLGSDLGIDLPGERPGFLPSKEWKLTVKKEPWYIGDTYHLSIGQGDLLVTPLQAAAWTSVFANGGTLYRPHLLKKISTNGVVYDSNTENILKQSFMSPSTIDIVRRGLRQTVTSGSAQILGGLPIQTAAKTGTAQWQLGKETHAWFTAFAPFNAQAGSDQIVVTVLVEEGGEGSGISARITKNFMQWYFGQYK